MRKTGFKFSISILYLKKQQCYTLQTIRILIFLSKYVFTVNLLGRLYYPHTIWFVFESERNQNKHQERTSEGNQIIWRKDVLGDKLYNCVMVATLRHPSNDMSSISMALFLGSYMAQPSNNPDWLQHAGWRLLRSSHPPSRVLQIYLGTLSSQGHPHNLISPTSLER